MILIVLETICLFTPYCFLQEHWAYDTSAWTYHGSSTLKYTENINIFGVSTGLGKILAVIVVALMLLSAAAFLLAVIQKNNGLTKIYYYTPAISFIALAVFAIYAYAFAEHDTTNWREEWTINWLFYVVIAIHIVTIAFSILLKLNKFEPAAARAVDRKRVDSEQTVSSADELKKYKELLDAGVITQEEFDTKKKQLLGLK